MHPLQASLVNQMASLMDRIGTKKESAGTTYLYKYTDPEGNTFYLDERKMTIKSPFSGKSFSTRPEKFTLSQMVKDVKEEAATPKTAAGTTYLYKYTDPEGNVFYLDERKMTIKSPFSGKSFSTRPEKFTLSQMVKDVKEEAAAPKTAAAAVYLYKYTDPEGNAFYLDERKMTIKSPFSGKSFSTRPEKFTLSQMVKDVKEEATPATKTAFSIFD